MERYNQVSAVSKLSLSNGKSIDRKVDPTVSGRWINLSINGFNVRQ